MVVYSGTRNLCCLDCMSSRLKEKESARPAMFFSRQDDVDLRSLPCNLQTYNPLKSVEALWELRHVITTTMLSNIKQD